jgi:hypothetical protein
VAAVGHVKGQLRVAIDSRHPQLIGPTETVRHVVRLRLYRPGFETIELTPQDQVEVVAWKQASDLAAEAKAVDDLLHTDSRRVFLSNEDKPPSVCIEHILPGSASEGHRKALLFAASEYERLAGLAKDEQQKHLLERSAQVRALATSSDAPKP